jgi:hypothetical protein
VLPLQATAPPKAIPEPHPLVTPVPPSKGVGMAEAPLAEAMEVLPHPSSMGDMARDRLWGVGMVVSQVEVVDMASLP